MRFFPAGWNMQSELSWTGCNGDAHCSMLASQKTRWCQGMEEVLPLLPRDLISRLHPQTELYMNGGGHSLALPIYIYQGLLSYYCKYNQDERAQCRQKPSLESLEVLR
jgi:hypothetical protein